MATPDFQNEKTFVMVKPDGVVKGLVGEIIGRFEQRGLKIVALKMFQPTREQMNEHYPKDETWIDRLGGKGKAIYEKYGLSMKEIMGTEDTLAAGRIVRQWLVDFMTSGPVVTMVVQGLHAVDLVRKLVGPTVPAVAEVGTIRGDYSVDSPALANAEKRALANLVHASETSDEAIHEINHWFGPSEIVRYRRGEVDSLFESRDV